MSRDVRLYGRGFGFGSQARVTAGFREVLAHHGRLAGFCDLDALYPEKAGSSARVGVFTGQLPLLPKMKFNAVHEQRWVVVAPNSTEIGTWTERQLEEFATHLIAPSHWAAEVLLRKTSLPVTVVPHGIEPQFAPPVEPLRSVKGFRVLHLSSTDRQRKGTRPLIEAWKTLRHAKLLPNDATLTLVLEKGALNTLRLSEDQLQSERYGITVTDRLGHLGQGLPSYEMAELYAATHLVVQPSRGEAFGMVPLESLACGTPIAATLCTGHSEYLEQSLPGLVPIAHGADAPLDDMPGSVGPTVTTAAVQDAILRAYQNWSEIAQSARDNASVMSQNWSWKSQLQQWITKI